MTDKPVETSLRLEWGHDPETLKQTITVANDPLPETVLLQQDVWQAAFGGNNWCWVSNSEDRTAERPLAGDFDHGAVLEEIRRGEGAWWVHFDTANLWASYRVAGVDGDVLTLQLKGWSTK